MQPFEIHPRVIGTNSLPLKPWPAAIGDFEDFPRRERHLNFASHLDTSSYDKNPSPNGRHNLRPFRPILKRQRLEYAVTNEAALIEGLAVVAASQTREEVKDVASLTSPLAHLQEFDSDYIKSLNALGDLDRLSLLASVYTLGSISTGDLVGRYATDRVAAHLKVLKEADLLVLKGTTYRATRKAKRYLQELGIHELAREMRASL